MTHGPSSVPPGLRQPPRLIKPVEAIAMLTPMDLPELRAALAAFSAERDWGQFHTPANLAKSISIEAAELLECFQWSDEATDAAHVQEELADVLTYCLLLADRLGVDPVQLVADKLEVTRGKYPAERVRGKSLRYDEYPD